SVASFFVSRVDTIVDKAIERKLKTATDGSLRAKLQGLLGTAAVANAKLAYRRFEEIFDRSDARWAKLADAGAQLQRPLLASTTMKNPARRDVLYVEELIAPHTVNTMPPQTIDAFRDHGEVGGDTARENVEQARAQIAALAEVGIDLDALTAQLEEEGIKVFAESYDALLDGTAKKAAELGVAAPAGG